MPQSREVVAVNFLTKLVNQELKRQDKVLVSKLKELDSEIRSKAWKEYVEYSRLAIIGVTWLEQFVYE